MPEESQRQRTRTVNWEEVAGEASVRILDQSRLPQEVHYVQLSHEREVAEAIESLKVRGAPAIGVTAAYGVALALCRLYKEKEACGETLTMEEAQEHLREVARMLSRTRPTAVNLFWALERMQRCAEQASQAVAGSVKDLVGIVKEEAWAIADEDYNACLQMGVYGAELIEDGDTVLTHCNAGALATAGLGTALAPIYVAHHAGKHLHVYVDETRPVLQGARLTAWELQQEGVPLTLITDNMAAHFMRYGKIKAIFVGADRIAANGDVANKIGTYSLAVLAKAHAIPFYVVAPCSTLDLKLLSGEQIPIEQRGPEEVTEVRGVRIAPPGVQVANPAFDVTPQQYISAIITENGIVRPPYDVNLRQVCTSDNLGKVRF